MPKREQAKRDVLLHDFRRWLDDYSFLENLLEVGSKWRFEGVDSDDPVSAAAQARAAIHLEPDEPIDDIIGLLESPGAKVFAEDFGLSKVFGFSAAWADNGPAIAVNTSPDISIERQIFTVAHELGHLIMHESSYVGVTWTAMTMKKPKRISLDLTSYCPRKHSSKNSRKALGWVSWTWYSMLSGNSVLATRLFSSAL